MPRPRKIPPRRLLRIVLLPALVAAGCSTIAKREPSLLPTAYQLKTGPFVVHSNEAMKADFPAVQSLEHLRDDLGTRLKSRTEDEDDRGPIEVYVLNDRSSFLHLLRFYFPELPPRRAFFLAQGDERIVYTYNGPMLEEDLRHEAAHALLRGRFGDIPLWLDEGLAEYFEVGPGDPHDREARLARLAADVKSGWKPGLRRLEGLKEVHEMDPRDYRESWAWVDLLLSDPGRGSPILVDYLLTKDERPSLAERLESRGMNGETLLAHMAGQPLKIAAQKSSKEDVQPERVVRLQDRPAESARTIHEPRRPSFFRRLGSWLGFGAQ